MESLLHSTEEDQNPSKLSEQMIRFTLHTLVALAIWVGLMMAGYALNPLAVPQPLILFASLLVPLIIGHIINRFRQDDMAPLVWLIGLIWLLIISLWILDMPTGPNECYKCEAGEKLIRTFFSFPMPSGLIDDDGPFIGTWPAAALLGYSIGARLALKKVVVEED
jgi:hypothetical protein